MRKLLIIISFILIHFFSCGNKNVFLYGEECKTITLSKARVNPHTQILLTNYEKQLSDLYTLGYREIPKEIERVILAKIQNREEGRILKDKTPNPFADIKAKTRYKTLSNGLFDEIHEAVDSIQYYHALLNTKTKKIIKLLPVETDNEYKVDPVVFALSVDPLSDKYPNISPYAYCAWNPVMLVDPDGRSTGWYEDNGEAKFDPKINSQLDVFNAGKTGKYYGDKGTEYAPDGTVNVLNPDGTKSTSVSSLKGVEIKGLSGNGAVSRAMEKSMNQGYDPNWLPEFNRCVEGGLNYIELQLNVVTFASTADDLMAGVAYKSSIQAAEEIGSTAPRTIESMSPHATNQAITRGFKTSDILKIVKEGTPQLSKGRYGQQWKYMLNGNTVVVNASKNRIITIFSNTPGTSKGLGAGYIKSF